MCSLYKKEKYSMLVKDIMTSDPACCTAEASLMEVAQLMVEYDCGEIPVIDSPESRKPIGVITDRDIVVRTLGEALDPTDMMALEIMSKPVVTVTPNTSFEECKHILEEKQIRRVPVVDEKGAICGIVALADITRYGTGNDAGEVLQEVVVDIGAPSNVT
jgi:CBS domain-containing protein